MKLIKRVFMMALVGAFFLQMPINVFAKEKNLSADEVFERSKVEKLQRKIDSMEVVQNVDSKDGIVRKGDVKSTGKYPRRKGYILVTGDAYKGLIPTGHAAIVYTKDQVVEALYPTVTKGKNNWYSSKKSCYGLSVIECTNQQEEKAADWCAKQINKDYNFNYFDVNTRDRFYCSQLVWAAFKDLYGIDLNTGEFGAAIHPLELVNSEETNLIYKK